MTIPLQTPKRIPERAGTGACPYIASSILFRTSRYKILITLLLSIFLPLFCNAHQLPELGNPSSTTLSPQQEQELGLKLLHSIEKQVIIIKDPVINSYLKSIGYTLVGFSKQPKTKLSILVIKDPAINAFSGPGGIIGFNSGLILLTKTESELASALAHEIIHTTQHHLARAFAKLKLSQIPSLVALLAAIAIGSSVSPSAGAAMATSTIAGQTQNAINFTREFEQEADQMAMQILYQAGYNPLAMVTLFERMEAVLANYDSYIPSYLQDHPVTASRIAEIKNRASRYPNKKYTSSLEYHLILARLRALITTNNKKLQHYYRIGIKQSSSAAQLAAKRYGYALALLAGKQFKQAATTTEQLLQTDSEQPLYQMLLAQIKLQQHQPKLALTILHQTFALHPDYYPLVLRYATTLLAANKSTAASQFIHKELSNHPNSVELYSLLTKAEYQAGNTAGAYLSKAKLYQIAGYNKLALLQLEQAQKLPHQTQDQLAIINAKIKRLQLQIRPN